VATADLESAHGRDKALAAVRPVVAGVPANTATRDALVRFVADRLNVPDHYLTTRGSAPSPALVPAGESPSAQHRPKLDAIARNERTFLAMCVGAADVGRDYVERLEPRHFTSQPLREVREHLLAHWEDPLAALPEEDPTLVALIKDVVMRADEEEVSAEALRLDFLKLDRQRVERALRHAEQDGDFEAQRALAGERQSLRDQIDDLMGMTL
jgi:hypothetical protein